MSKMAYMELDTQLELLLWYKNLRDTNNETFLELFQNESRYLVLKGGGGSGKSIFAGRKILERCVSERNHRFLVCRKVGKTIRESCFTQLVGQISEHYSDTKVEINKGDMQIRFPETQGEIIFSGLDDVEKLKSIYNITGIWIEEASELLEGDFNQLDIRLRGETEHYKQIIISFNPISILHWLKLRFFDRAVDDATVHESTYKDNRFLDEAAKKVLEDFKETDEYYYSVYCLGQWGITGKTVFDAKAVQKRLSEITAPRKVGYYSYEYDGLEISDVEFAEDDRGYINIYQEPKKGRPYIIGVDTAGDGSDSSVAQVLDGITLEQVATLISSNLDEDLFAKQVYCLGTAYETALIGVESNFSTYCIRELERLKYKRQYVREIFDDATHKVQLKFGFNTNAKTRNVIISNLVKLVREDVSFVNDKKTLEEMLTFIRNEDTFKPEAEEGAHDDTIMALAIACHIRDSGQIPLVERSGDNKKNRVKWTTDMWDDYYAASPEDRKMLEERWGKPDR